MNDANTICLSVVVPVYNEEGSVGPLHREIVRMTDALTAGRDLTAEIIFVNDGSTDRTDDVCRTLSPLHYIRLQKNSGQTAAMDCGFHASRGQYIACLDADGQNDPADIPAMLKMLKAGGYDAVCGWRYERKDTVPKRVMSLGARFLRRVVIGDPIHDSGCTLKVFKRKCIEGWHLKSSQHRFIPALFRARGFKVGEVKVNHRPRLAGASKYGFSRIFSGLGDLFELRREFKRGQARGASQKEAGVSYIVAEEVVL